MYKVIYENMIIDIIEQPEYIRYIERQKRGWATDPTSANGISASDGSTYYHVEGMPPFPEECEYKTVQLVEIDDEEYNALQSQLVSAVAVHSDNSIMEVPALEPVVLERESTSLLEMQEKIRLLEKQVNELLKQKSHTGRKRGSAVGKYSNAEGHYTTASNYYSHAEGHGTAATGQSSHAEGSSTVASGKQSHAEGIGTIAAGTGQHVQGSFNIENKEPLHIVGNGTGKSDRSNAHTLDFDGNAWFAGDVYVGSTGGRDKDEGSKKLITIDDIETYSADTESTELYLKSNTADSPKRFKITVDDTGTLTVTEVTT